MVGFSKCVRHDEIMCPVCCVDKNYQRSALALMALRERLTEARDQLSRDILTLNSLIQRAQVSEKKKS